MRCVMSIIHFLLPVINRTYSRLSASVSVLFVFSQSKSALLFGSLIRQQFLPQIRLMKNVITRLLMKSGNGQSGRIIVSADPGRSKPNLFPASTGRGKEHQQDRHCHQDDSVPSCYRSVYLPPLSFAQSMKAFTPLMKALIIPNPYRIPVNSLLPFVDS